MINVFFLRQSFLNSSFFGLNYLLELIGIDIFNFVNNKILCCLKKQTSSLVLILMKINNNDN